jgi:uncharacterized protein (TIGR00255 family)
MPRRHGTCETPNDNKQRLKPVAIQSMTGFARAEGHGDGESWAWELRSVNARGLDLRCRVPGGLEWLDPLIRQSVGKRFKRGGIQIGLTVARDSGQQRIAINRDLLDQLIALQAELGSRVDAAPPRLDALLQVRGVVELAESAEDEDGRKRRERRLLDGLDQAIGQLEATRLEEGGRLLAVLGTLLDQIGELTGTAGGLAALQPETQKRRLETQLAELLGPATTLPPERLAQEVALLAQRADVREELDRLIAHIASAREMLAAGGAVGRRLDFLCQELNREANTTCSKSSDLELTRVGLALKTTIEQFREQVQNVE